MTRRNVYLRRYLIDAIKIAIDYAIKFSRSKALYSDGPPNPTKAVKGATNQSSVRAIGL